MGGTPCCWWGGTPFQVWAGGYLIPGLDLGGVTPSCSWGVPPSRIRTGVPPVQDWMGYPLSKIGWVLLHPRLDGVPPPSKTGWVPPSSKTGWVPSLSKTGWGTSLHQETDQQSEHLLRGRRCASCVHAGGLSCIGQNTLWLHIKRQSGQNHSYFRRESSYQ